jgi:hypothetical protein
MKPHFPEVTTPAQTVTDMETKYLQYKNDLASIRSDMDSAIDFLHNKMAEVKSTITKQGQLMEEMPPQVGKKVLTRLTTKVSIQSFLTPNMQQQTPSTRLHPDTPPNLNLTQIRFKQTKLSNYFPHTLPASFPAPPSRPVKHPIHKPITYHHCSFMLYS